MREEGTIPACRREGSPAPASEDLPERARLLLGLLLAVVLPTVRDADLAAHRTHITDRGWGTAGHHRARAAIWLLLHVLRLRRRVLVAAIGVVRCACIRVRRTLLVLAHPPRRRDRHADLCLRSHWRRRARAGREVRGVSCLGASADESGRRWDHGVPGLRRAPAILPVLAIVSSPLVVLRAWLGSVLYLREKLVLAL